MITTASVLSTNETNPYRNLAMEQALLATVRPGEMILYLWQNRRTVVIGKNQNAFDECRLDLLSADSGFLARRPSGGGAVFHDMGNLCFTFLTRKEDYDVPRQLSVICKALEPFALKAEFSGRNDLLIDGRKFSGNAFQKKGDFCLHHGTLLVNVDTEQMTRYLNVPTEKLRSKGVSSVRSRVVNLSSLNPDLTVSSLWAALPGALGREYRCAPQSYDLSRLDPVELERTYLLLASDSWRLGRQRECSRRVSSRFEWGCVSIELCVTGSMVEYAKLYTDAMEVDFAALCEQALQGGPAAPGAMVARLELAPWGDKNQYQMAMDVASLLLEPED